MILDDILLILKSKSNKKAYTVNGKSYTYNDLYKYVCNIYKELLNENETKKPVIIIGHKEIYMKASILACLYAGMTYIPIDDSMPVSRINSIVDQIKPEVVIGNFKYNNIKNISKDKINILMEKDIYEDINKIYLNENDISYIIYTSGSTGIPKGVKVTYKNLDSCINWLKEITNIESGVILNQANFSFDLSVADFYLSLISESEHYIIENNLPLNFKEIFESLKTSNANFAVLTPSFIDILLLDKSFSKDLFPNLKTIIFCGEKLLSSTVKKIYSRFDDISIINCYGPTECTFAVTSIKLTKYIEYKDIPVGKPKKDVEIFIVDDNRNKIEEGKIGEILITGNSVADGYVNNLKNESFFEYEGKKAYITGDLGYVKDGNLYCIGRKDSQIKYKGYRIELLDIEKNIQSLDYIDKVKVVCIKNDENKVLNIVAFIKLKENSLKTQNEIKDDLKIKLPYYMCPKIKIVEEFPINKNGKCDERKLLEEYKNGK